MKINLVFDSSMSLATTSQVQGLEAAAAILDNLIADPITVTIRVGIDEVGGSPMLATASGQGGPTSWAYYSYAQVQAALQSNVNSALAQQVVSALPAQSQTDASGILLSPAEAYALGLATPTAGAVDGMVGFASTYSLPVYSTVVYAHELTHALGRIRNDSLMSLYSYTAPGVLAPLPGSLDGGKSYFSIDGGKTNLETYDTVSDWSDWAYPGPNPGGQDGGMGYVDGTTDIALLTAMGFKINAAPVVTDPIRFQPWSAGQKISFAIPSGTFYSAQAMTYAASMADGSPLPAWLTFNPGTQTFSGTVPVGGLASSQITITASNALGTVTDTFNAGQPILFNSSLAAYEVAAKGAAFSYNLALLFSGPLSSNTQYYVAGATVSNGIYSFTSSLPAWMSFNAATATLSGTMPAAGGHFAFIAYAENPDGNYSGVAVPIYNFAPPTVAKQIPAQTIQSGQAFSITIPAGTFSDPNGTITSSSILAADETVAGSLITTPPAWMSYNASTMTLSGTAPAVSSGKWWISLSATDSNGESVNTGFFLNLGSALSVAAASADFQAGTVPASPYINDSSANVMANLDAIQHMLTGGLKLQGIQLTDSGTPSATLSLAQTVSDWGALSLISTPIAITVPDSLAVDAFSFSRQSFIASFAVKDTAANVAGQLDVLQSVVNLGKMTSISLTDGSINPLNVKAAQLASDAAALAELTGTYNLSVAGNATAASASSVAAHLAAHLKAPIAVSDSAANVATALDSLEALASSAKLSSISLTDGAIPVVSITAAQLASDASAINDISGYFTLMESAPAGSTSITGAGNSLGNTLVFGGTASQYHPSAVGDGVHLSVGGDLIANVQALKFSDYTLIVAATPSSGTVTTGNITELYGAVFGRLPDVPGLAYYQQELAANPALSLTSLAQNFLASPEYTGNSAHNYAQTSVGDTQFVTDLYNNLLHRAPGSGDAAWYEANVIAPIVGNAQPGTSAYTSALALAHAYVVTDFSQSAEFLGNVQVTAAHPADATHWLVLI